MRKFIHLKFISLLLVVVMLTIAINGVLETAHALQRHATAVSDHVSSSEILESHQCPCAPLEPHNDFDGCDTCVNCSCHAPLTIQQLMLSYNPLESDMHKSTSFNFLPEVYLSLFVPPDSAAV